MTSDKELDRFDEALRVYGRRSSQTPPQIAARRILQKLPQRHRPSFGWRLGLASAAMIIVFAGAWLTIRHQRPVPQQKNLETVTRILTPIPEGVAVHWLNSGTPVYFILEPIGSVKGEKR